MVDADLFPSDRFRRQVAQYWSLHQTHARLACGRITALLELTRPDTGLHQVRIGDRRMDGNLLQVLLPPSALDVAGEAAALNDRFTRGDDVVASYGPDRADGCRYQLVWRGLPDDRDQQWVGGVELVVSVQTERWVGQPEIRVQTRAAVDEWMTFDGAAVPDAMAASGQPPSCASDREPRRDVYLFRAAHGGATCVVMIHPSDSCGAEVMADECGMASVSFRIFARKLEKGVILKSRLRCGFVDRHGDLPAARQAYRQFSESRPPLSA